jgi:RNA polymerase subunit RPABC4/transcription elongation factor Spt4
LEEALARGVQIFLALSAAYLLALWFALAVWAYRDIGARSQSVVTQVVGTLLVVLFSIPGALLYLLLRPKETLDEAYQRSLEEEYLLQDLEEVSVCHSCQRPVEDEFILCPHCQTSLKEACPACAKLISVRWSICPYCGANQSDQSALIREQLPQPEERFIERGAGTFRPLEAPPETIRERPAIAYSEREPLIGPPIPVAGLEMGGELFIEPVVAEQEPAEPIRLFDRQRTRMLRAAERAAASNGTHAGLNGAGSGSAANDAGDSEVLSDDLYGEFGQDAADEIADSAAESSQAASERA